MDQTIINWLLAGFGTLLGLVLGAVWQAMKDLQTSDKEIVSKIASIEVLVAGSYVRREELADLTKALFAKLDKIEGKLDQKADK